MKIMSSIKETIKSVYRKFSDKVKRARERKKKINQERIAEYEKNEQRYQEFRKNRAAKKYERREAKREKEVWVDNVPKTRNFHTIDDFDEYPVEEYILRKPQTDDKLKNYGRTAPNTSQQVSNATEQNKNASQQVSNATQQSNAASPQTNITIIINGEQVSSVDVDSDNSVPKAHYSVGSAKPDNSAKPDSSSAKPVVIKSNTGENKIPNVDKNGTVVINNSTKPHPGTSAKPDSSDKFETTPRNKKETLDVKEGFLDTFEVAPMNLFGDDSDEG